MREASTSLEPSRRPGLRFLAERLGEVLPVTLETVGVAVGRPGRGGLEPEDVIAGQVS